MTSSDPASLVAAFYQRVRAGEHDAALTSWAPGAVWHLAGNHRNAGDHSIGAYIDLLTRWFREHPHYRAQWLDTRTYGSDFVVGHLRSTGGERPGEASGLAVYRVGGDLLQEGWGIPADPRYGF